MATVASVNAKGHAITIVSTEASGWGVVEIDETKLVQLTVDDGGSFERVLHAHLGFPVSGPTVSTVTNPNDTVTAVFWISGVDPNDGSGISRYKDCHTGETVNLTQCDAAIFGDGSITSDAVVGDPAITNNSTVDKPRPICGWADAPEPLSIQRQSIVDVACMAGCGYEITQVEFTITDSGLDTATGLATLEIRDRAYPYGPDKIPVWRASVDCSALADGDCLVSFVATTEAGSTFDSNAFGLDDMPFTLDADASELLPTVYVDSSSQLAVTGTYSVAQDTIITGDTSGAQAIVEEDATNDAEIKIVMTTTINFSAAENISGLDSGSATADGAQVQNWSGSPVVEDVDNPSSSIAGAFGLGKTARNNAGSPDTYSGTTAKVLSRYVYVTRNNGFGSASATGHRTIVEPNYDGRCRIIRERTGESSGNQDHRLWRTLYKDCEFYLFDNTGIVFAKSSADPIWFMSKNSTPLRATGATGTLGNAAGKANPQWHIGVYSDTYWPYTSSGREGEQIKVILDSYCAPTAESDVIYYDGDSDGISGNGTVVMEVDHVQGSANDLDDGDANGLHGDLMQMVGNCVNMIGIFNHTNNGYQGVFCNDSVDTQSVDGLWISGLFEAIDDSAWSTTTAANSMGPGPVAFHESVTNLLMENVTTIRPPSLTAIGGEGGFGNIPSTVQCDNWFIRNSVFSHIELGDGSQGAQAPEECAYVNCHTINGASGVIEAVGIRGTISSSRDNYAELFEKEWSDGVGTYPSDATFGAKAGGPLDNRLVADDIINSSIRIDGNLLTVGGSIGALSFTVAEIIETLTRSLDAAISPSAIPSPTYSVKGLSYPTRRSGHNIEEMPLELPVLRPATVVLEDTDSNHEVRYTINGKNPTSKSKLYSGPLVLTRNLTGSDNTIIKARIYNKLNPNIKSRITKIRIRVV